MSAAWIVACLVAIAALYGLLFATAHALHVAEQDRESGTREGLSTPAGSAAPPAKPDVSA